MEQTQIHRRKVAALWVHDSWSQCVGVTSPDRMVQIAFGADVFQIRPAVQNRCLSWIKYIVWSHKQRVIAIDFENDDIKSPLLNDSKRNGNGLSNMNHTLNHTTFKDTLASDVIL